MSVMLMVKAMQAKVGNPLRKLVLIKLADNASDIGECWPSHQHVADQCEISKTSVKKHIKVLEEMGFLRVEHREGPKGNSSNMYRLTIKYGAGDALGGAGDALGGGAAGDPRTSHSLEPVKEPKETLSSSDDAVSVLKHLNAVCGTKYKATTKAHIRFINGRLKDHSVDDLKAVIDYKFKQWGSDPKMAQYLRPQTLFSDSNFNGYLMAAKNHKNVNTQGVNYVGSNFAPPEGW